MAMHDKKQRQWLECLAIRIPLLFDAIEAGNTHSEYVLGVRVINGRKVTLKLQAVVDFEGNPMETHGHVPKTAKL